MGFYNLVQRISSRSASRRVFLYAAFSLSAFVFSGAAVAPAFAEDVILADFMAQPMSPYVHEMVWNGNELYEGPGAIGTGYGNSGAGDGELATKDQMAPGLLIQTPFEISGIAGSEINTASIPSITSFFDSTLDISPLDGAARGIPATGPATLTDLGSGLTLISQPLGRAKFEIWSTDPVAGHVENDYTLLLAGTIESATITAFAGQSAGAVLSAAVHYTDGAILDAAGFDELYGELSWSLLNATPKFGMLSTGSYLKPFEANATGQFTAEVPEPGTIAMLLAAAVGLSGYAWRKRRS